MLETHRLCGFVAGVMASSLSISAGVYFTVHVSMYVVQTWIWPTVRTCIPESSFRLPELWRFENEVNLASSSGNAFAFSSRFVELPNLPGTNAVDKWNSTDLFNATRLFAQNNLAKLTFLTANLSMHVYTNIPQQKTSKTIKHVISKPFHRISWFFVNSCLCI